MPTSVAFQTSLSAPRGNAPALVESLRRSRWFAGLPAALQHEIVSASVVQRYERGEVVIKEGAPPRGMFAVLEGRFHATRFLADGREVLLHVGTEGLWFGDYGCFTGKPSVGGVIAAARSKLLFLPKAQFERIVAAEPGWFRLFAEVLFDRHAVMYRYLAEIQGLTPEQVLAVRLRDLANQWGATTATEGPFEIRVTQAELASMIGVSRQTLSGFLAKLAARGAIEVAFGSIRVVDLRALEAGSGR